jgi:hypothetical protein
LVRVTAPGAAADRDSVSPLDALAVVPEMFVSASVGFPWEWVEAAYAVSTDPPTDPFEFEKLTPFELANTIV